MGKDNMLESISRKARRFMESKPAVVSKKRNKKRIKRVGELFPAGGEEEFNNLRALWELTPNNVAPPIELKKNEHGVVEGYSLEWIQGPHLLKKLRKNPELPENTRRQIIETVMTWQHAQRAHGDITTQNIIIKRDGTPVFIDPIGYPDKPATIEMLEYDLEKLNRILQAPELIATNNQRRQNKQ